MTYLASFLYLRRYFSIGDDLEINAAQNVPILVSYHLPMTKLLLTHLFTTIFCQAVCANTRVDMEVSIEVNTWRLV